MRRYRVRFTEEAEADLVRLYDFLVEKNPATARAALRTIRKGVDLLKHFPYACRKAGTSSAYIRELVISFGEAGYVLLFEIEPPNIVTVLAARHQREDDFA